MDHCYLTCVCRFDGACFVFGGWRSVDPPLFVDCVQKKSKFLAKYLDHQLPDGAGRLLFEERVRQGHPLAERLSTLIVIEVTCLIIKSSPPCEALETGKAGGLRGR